jgi:uncharacterized protein (TIGR03435 family)
MKRAIAGFGLVTLLSSLLLGQSTKKPTAFEVADVHVSPPGTNQTDGGFMPGGRAEIRGATMLDLISDAYGVDAKMVVGGPSWLNSDRFDIIAKAQHGVTSGEALQEMLKNLLAERFKLVVREEKKEMPVYVLTVGKKGAKLPAASISPPLAGGCLPPGPRFHGWKVERTPSEK